MTAHSWGCIDDALPWRRVEVTADVCACRRCGPVLGRIVLSVRAQ